MNTSMVAPTPASFSTGLVTARFHETWDFYTALLGFRTLEESDDEVRLVHPAGAVLTVLREETDGQPAELIPATTGRGLWFTLEVADVTEEYARLRREGAAIVSALTADRGGGQRFAVRDPNGVLVLISARAWS